jgi:uncharacterized membrane protein HdeD (DUF308 family)
MNRFIKYIKEKKLIFDILNVILGIILIILCVLLLLFPITFLHIGAIAIIAGIMNILNGLRKSSRESTSRSMVLMSVMFGGVLFVFGLVIVIIG